MGVHNLWGVLSEGQGCWQDVELEKLSGKRLAVDLSVWIIQCQQLLKGSKAPKPHLLNIFNKAMGCAKLDIRLVFCTDGAAPDLKHKPRPGGVFKKVGSSSKFVRWIQEATQMLRTLGFFVVDMKGGQGEAEAMCGLLNKLGVVDGVITTDADAFLFGAQTVYKELSVNVNSSVARCYSLPAITANLGLGPNKLICLALLLGADYTEGGVPGVGEKQALRLMDSLAEDTALDIFRGWLAERDVSVLPSYELWGEEQLAETMASLGLKKRSKPGMVKALEKIWLRSNAESLQQQFPKVDTEELTFIGKMKTKLKARYDSAQFEAITKAYLVPGLKIRDVYRLLGQEGAVRGLDVPICMNLAEAQAYLCKELLWEPAVCLGKLQPVVFTTALYWGVHLARSALPFAAADYTEGWEPTQILKKKIDHFKDKFVIEWQRASDEVVISTEGCGLVQQALPHLYLLFQQAAQEKEQAKGALACLKLAQREAREEKRKVREQQKTENSAKKATRTASSPVKAKPKLLFPASGSPVKRQTFLSPSLDLSFSPYSTLEDSGKCKTKNTNSSNHSHSSSTSDSSSNSGSNGSNSSHSSDRGCVVERDESPCASIRNLHLSSSLTPASDSCPAPSPLPSDNMVSSAIFKTGEDRKDSSSPSILNYFCSPRRSSVKKKLFRTQTRANLLGLSPSACLSSISSASSPSSSSSLSSSSSAALSSSSVFAKGRGAVAIDCSDDEKHTNESTAHDSHNEDEDHSDNEGGFIRDCGMKGGDETVITENSCRVPCSLREEDGGFVKVTNRAEFIRNYSINEPNSINDNKADSNGTSKEDNGKASKNINPRKAKKREVFEISSEDEADGNLIVLSYTTASKDTFSDKFGKHITSLGSTTSHDKKPSDETGTWSKSILGDRTNLDDDKISHVLVDCGDSSDDLSAASSSVFSSSCSSLKSKILMNKSATLPIKTVNKMQAKVFPPSTSDLTLATGADTTMTAVSCFRQSRVNGWVSHDARSSGSALESTASCPICGKAFALSTIERHANQCIEQQEQQDGSGVVLSSQLHQVHLSTTSITPTTTSTSRPTSIPLSPKLVQPHADSAGKSASVLRVDGGLLSPKKAGKENSPSPQISKPAHLRKAEGTSKRPKKKPSAKPASELGAGVPWNIVLAEMEEGGRKFSFPDRLR